MHKLNVENHLLRSGSLLPSYLTRDLVSNAGLGKTIVISETPKLLMNLVEAEFAKLEVCADPRLTLSANAPDDLLEADVTFATANDILRSPPVCYILYVASPVERSML